MTQPRHGGDRRLLAVTTVTILVAVASLIAACGGSGSTAGSATAPGAASPAAAEPDTGKPDADEAADDMPDDARPDAGESAGQLPTPRPTTDAAEVNAEVGTPVAQPLGPSEPVRVRIPELGVDHEVIDVGLAADGTMQVPRGPDPIGWYDRSPTPGEIGPAVLIGHLTWNGTDGVFRRLADLRHRDLVHVERVDGSAATFAVTRIAQYSQERFPTARVYGNTTASELRLITCSGEYDATNGSFEDNTVVFARLT